MLWVSPKVISDEFIKYKSNQYSWFKIVRYIDNSLASTDSYYMLYEYTIFGETVMKVYGDLNDLHNNFGDGAIEYLYVKLEKDGKWYIAYPEKMRIEIIKDNLERPQEVVITITDVEGKEIRRVVSKRNF